MNLLKCTFALSFEKFLGFTIRKKGTDLYLAKVKTIQAIKPSTTCKQLKSFLWKVAYVRTYWLNYSSCSRSC